MITVEAEISTNGIVTLLEPIKVSKKSKAKVIVYDDVPENEDRKGNAAMLMALMRSNRLPGDARISDEDMEAQIEEARNSWD